MKSLARLVNAIIKKVMPSNGEWEHGTISNGSKARRHTKTGEVQFLLWKAGEQGHKDGFWHKVGSGWEETFKKEES